MRLIAFGGAASPVPWLSCGRHFYWLILMVPLLVRELAATAGHFNKPILRTTLTKLTPLYVAKDTSLCNLSQLLSM